MRLYEDMNPSSERTLILFSKIDKMYKRNVFSVSSNVFVESNI